MAKFNPNIGMWVASNGAAFPTQAQAEAADRGAGAGSDTGAFGQGGVNPFGQTFETLNQAIGGVAADAEGQAVQRARAQRQVDETLSGIAYGSAASPTAVGYKATQNKIGTGTTQITAQQQSPAVDPITGQPTQQTNTGVNLQSTSHGGQVVGGTQVSFFDPATGESLTEEQWRVRNPGKDPSGYTTPPAGAGGAGGPGDGYTPGSNAIEGNNSVDGLMAQLDNIRQQANITRDPAELEMIRQAQKQIQDTIDAIMSKPSDARIIAEQMAAEQRGQALSARGGAAAQQQALRQASTNAPQLATAASQAVRQEETERLKAVGNLANTSGQLALGSEQNQIRIGESNQNAANNFINQASQLGGLELQLNQSDRHELGQAIRDWQKFLAENQLEYDKLTLEDKWKLWEDHTKRYAISEDARTSLATAKENNKETALDWFNALNPL